MFDIKTLERESILSWIKKTPNASHKVRKQSIIDDDTPTNVVSQGNFWGVDDNSTSDTNKYDIFRDPKYLPTAVSSILERCQKLANFHPSTDFTDETPENFDEYLRQIDECPFIHLVSLSSDRRTYESKNYNDLIDAVISCYPPMSPAAENEMVNKIAEMGKSIFSQSSAEATKDLFDQVNQITDQSKDNSQLLISNTTLHMKYEKGKSEVTEQSFEVTVRTYEVLTAKIHRYADILEDIDREDVSGWTKKLTTPESRSELCFTPEVLHKFESSH
ncbi:hypothetical protein [Photobacterium sp. 1_MG-2023]|uniref:hypothetical protein n=1 Tax=Photobacterium sp. 1_MG-2023 TaxID=3062646 RepID=UPI0026E38C25|nr:hypothetical protein [Photobacterium sp. 1_MG-2023]MDO6706774.1 hypothetical protein [Photobacterium sp. 1_MG-2023]